MSKPPDHLTLTRKQERLIEASALIQAEPPERIDFLHTVQCQCGIPNNNPGDDVREWDRKQGNAHCGSKRVPRSIQRRANVSGSACLTEKNRGWYSSIWSAKQCVPSTLSWT